MSEPVGEDGVEAFDEVADGGVLPGEGDGGPRVTRARALRLQCIHPSLALALPTRLLKDFTAKGHLDSY